MGDKTKDNAQINNGEVNKGFQPETAPDTAPDTSPDSHLYSSLDSSQDNVLEIPDMVGLPSAEMVDEGIQTKDHPQVHDGIILRFQDGMESFFRTYGGLIGKLVLLALLIGYTVYFIFAVLHRMDHNTTALIVLTCLTVFFIVYGFIRDHFGDSIYTTALEPIERFFTSQWYILKWIFVPAVLVGVVVYLSLDVIQDVKQLQSVSGMIVFIFLLYLFSKYPNQVNWRPVIWGFGLQFLMGILVLRFKPGFEAVKWLSNEITVFINYALEGAATVFGNPMLLFHPFVFVVMPMLIYIGAVMSILYHLGITQVVAGKLGWFVQITMGTTAIESLGVGANIFLNGMDTMLMLRSYLHKLTRSEFHCFLVGNHSTVAGFAFATFVMFGAPPQHLLSAAVMSAPAAIAVCKLNYPETEESETKTQADVQLDRGRPMVVEAAANGAAVAGKTVTAVVVNYIGFMSLLAFINATLLWIGERVGYMELTFEVICSYLFFPLSVLMGIELDQCQEVAKLIGLKVFTSELLAYQELGVSITNGLISERSASIATYALCGFSSLSTLAIAVGVWNAVCPTKTQEMASQLVRVIINANLSCFMTACVAGIMYDPDMAGPGDTDTSWITALLGLLPGYKSIMSLMPGF